MQIEIERVSPCKLCRQVWQFYVMAGYGAGKMDVRLTQWQTQRRETAKHKWQKSGEGYRFRNMNTHHHFGYCQPAAAVPMGPDVIEDVRQAILERMVVIGAEDPAPISYDTATRKYG